MSPWSIVWWVESGSHLPETPRRTRRADFPQRAPQEQIHIKWKSAELRLLEDGTKAYFSESSSTGGAAGFVSLEHESIV